MQAEAFNALTIPINQTNLIEASAGTGKTWSIAALFLRLILIEHMDVDKILVVTFTNAATAELKTRLRSRLDEALRELKLLEEDDVALEALQQRFVFSQQANAQAPLEPFLHEVLQQALQKESASRLRLRLQAALSQFDHAGIFTIHGFCQRVLREFAFLCQVPFQITLADDTTSHRQRLAADFWRKNVLQDAQLSQLCFQQNLTLEQVLGNIRHWFTRFPDDLHFQLQHSEHSVDTLTQLIEETSATLLAQWETLHQTFVRIHPALNGKYIKLETFERLFADIPMLLAQHQTQAIDSKDRERLAKLDAGYLQQTIKKNQAISDEDAHAFADIMVLLNLLEQQQQAKQALFDRLHHDLYLYLLPAWQQEKQRLQQLGFDDLLTDVAQALHHPQYGAQLATYISERMWQMALIDEFQDTDSVQYGIFDTIFRQRGKPVFLVGDPKQAIYRFRGADIHAYLHAKQEADRQYTLSTNRRTHQSLVDGVNALFMNKTQPFLFAHIDYISVQASREHSHLQPNATPLEVQYLHQDDEVSLTKEIARKRAAEYCAADIARHLALSQQGQMHYQGELLQAKHIAVLVRTHDEGELVQQCLHQHHISSVVLSKDSIFSSAQAKTVLTLLQWWQTPQQQGLLRSVLAGPLLNYRTSDLVRLNLTEHQDQLIAWIEDAALAQSIWQQRGVYAAWQMFDKKRGISAGFLSRNDKRGLTNVQQLFELLAHEESERFGTEALVQWYSEQITEKPNNPAYTLRLESDEELVQIVTMHSSKGLQYPIVFCPFVWNSRAFKPADFNLVNQDNVLNIVSQSCLSEEAQQLLREDEHSENLRLLYVALTRAEEKLVLSCCLLPTKNEDNVLYHLISPEPSADMSENVALWQTQDKDKRAWFATLWQDWAQKHQIAFLWRPVKPDYEGLVAPAQAQLQYHALQAQLPFYRLQEYTSFSGISRHVSHVHSDELVPEMDVGELHAAALNPTEIEEAEAVDNPFDLFHFQRGTEAGLCLHALLEETDFSVPAAAQNERYVPIFEQYRIDEVWYPALYQMIDATRLAQLDAEVDLAQLPATHYLSEMGFVMRVDAFKVQDIVQWLLQSNLPTSIKQMVQGLQFRDVSGFLNGYIDLTCISLQGQVYVIDYKSNHLGNLPENYASECLNQAINQHHYYLQALIYAIAIKRYLHSRQFAFEAIHIRYLFLRGLKAQSQQGIWRWDIDSTHLEAIDAALAS